MRIFHKLLLPFRYHQGLDVLLRDAPAESGELRSRLDWVDRLVNWVRKTGPSQANLELKQPERVQTTRLKYILLMLDRDPATKLRVATTLRSIIHDTRSIELFMHVGVPNQQGFIGEFIERLNLLLLPQAPHDHDLVSVFSETFRFESDADWITNMDPAVFSGWLNLFSFSEDTEKPNFNNLIRDANDALFLLSHSVRSIGLSRLVRNRVAEQNFREIPFYLLTDRIERFVDCQESERDAAFAGLKTVLQRCFITISEVQLHLRDRGASIELVYQMGRLKAHLQRTETLINLLNSRAREPEQIQQFLGLLVRENLRARKLSTLFNDNLVLLCQKIVETNAETGEHYITRDRNEQWEILKKSFGGGTLTGLTTFFKFLLYHVRAAPFVLGSFSFLNYAVSFISLQAMGFTLATKQPAMTASALSAKLEGAHGSVSALVEEVVHLARSQITAVMGNITGVVPIVVLIDMIFTIFKTHLTDAEHATHTIESFSILGPTPLYAAGTGVLLWLSSIFAGWFVNWFHFRGLAEAIEHHHRLGFLFGKARTRQWAESVNHHAGGVASNISLAFLLAMTPQIATFFGFPFDVRHVTLSSGALTASAMSLGSHVFAEWRFWSAVGGVLSMGVLNLAVAFALALGVAIWAQSLSAPNRGVIYRALLKKFTKEPWRFFIPPPAPPG